MNSPVVGKLTPYKLITGSFVLLIGLVFLFFIVSRVSAAPQSSTSDQNGRLLTIHDRGTDSVVLTDANTVGEALARAGIVLDDKDAVEPSRDEQLVASEYEVNIYRARPVLVIDGATKQKVITPYQIPEQIAASVGITLYPEDKATIARADDILSSGAGLVLTIERATEFRFDLYGKTIVARTQAKTVGDMLIEKGIKLGANDKTSPSPEAGVTEGMLIKVWREGRQTVTVAEKVDFEIEIVYDGNREVGYRAIGKRGVNGTKQVTYEVVIKNGKEAGRKAIASVTTKQSSKQVEIVGAKTGGGLTESKGVNFYEDSRGITHRETYYDLPMGGTMGYCSGTYSVRADGAKVDQSGYILVAANLSRYPRCSIVETSLGLGKVYDTGSFVAVYPDGFDLATDWTKRNGI